LLIFIHGGYWQANDKTNYGFIADPVVSAGGATGQYQLWLGAELLATDWPALGVPANLVRGITAISGVFDLAPLIETSINNKLGLDQNSARQCSPPFHSPTNSAPVTVAVGGDETEEFLRQAKSYTACCQTAGCAADLLRLNGFNHYTVLNQMSDANATLMRAVLHQMDWA
jgi:arylformamidase